MTRSKQIITFALLCLLFALAACRERDLAENLPPDLPSESIPEEQPDGSDPVIVVPDDSNQPDVNATADPNQPDSGSDIPPPPAGEDEGATGGETGEDSGDEGTGAEPTPSTGTTTDDEQQDSGGQEVAPTATPEQQSGSTDSDDPDVIIHVVRSGETISEIAQQYQVTIEDIAVANDLQNVDRITTGVELRIVGGAAEQRRQEAEESGTPAADSTAFDPNDYTVYIVRYGDSLFEIGRRFGFTLEELAEYNNITNVNRIDVGQEIRIPNR